MPRRASAHPTTAYAERVLAGKIVAGELVRLACQRHLADLGRDDVRFDRDLADRGLSFFPDVLRFTKGARAGEPFMLEPWQSFVVGSVLGWQRPDRQHASGWRRRFRSALILVGKKNGKSEMMAGLGLYGLVADGEHGAEVYSAATTRDQAALVWGAALEMRNRSPELSQHIGASSRRDTHGRATGGMWVQSTPRRPGGGTFVPLGRDKDTMDGVNPSLVIVDELHRHKTRDVFDLLGMSGAARRQPLLLAISTAGAESAGVCWEEREAAIRVLRGTTHQDDLFAYLAEIDEGDDWQDETVWAKANPNLGVSVTVDGLREDVAKAVNSPPRQASFIRYRCNRWTAEPGEVFIMPEVWRRSGAKPIPEGPLYVGIDVAARTDWCAVSLYWPETKSCDWQFYLPAEGIAERTARDRVPIGPWAEQGLITLCEGSVVDLREVRRYVSGVLEGERVGGGLVDRYEVAEVALDPWGATQLMRELGEDGLTVVPFRQGFQSMSDPCKSFEALALRGEFRHGQHPIAAWMVDNTRIVRDVHDNWKPVKMDGKQGRRRCDGTVALLMAFGRATVGEGQGRSVYDERGPVWIAPS